MMMALAVLWPLLPTADSPAWRNDAANLRLVAAWGAYLEQTPLSDDYGGDSISDDVPIRLEWSVGSDMPIGWKNGVACRFGDTVVTAGGLVEGSAVWEPAMDRPGFNLSSKTLRTVALAYNLTTETWSALSASPPFVPGRTQGCCSTKPGAEAMFIVSGGDAGICASRPEACGEPSIRGNVTVLTRSGSGWNWGTLPPLPPDGERMVGAAGLVDGEWLLLTGGAQIDPGADPGSKHQQRRAVPDYRLRLQTQADSSGFAAASGWERMATHPLSNTTSGLTLPLGGALGRFWFQFGGQTADAKRAAAFVKLQHVCAGLPDCRGSWPTTDASGGLYMPRQAFRYDVDNDQWTAIASLPRPMQGGGAQQVLALGRNYLALLGTSQDESFRVGAQLPTFHQQGPPGAARYYGDYVYLYDTARDRYSRAGKLLYGTGTCSWVAADANASRILGFGGEPMHGFNHNSETAVQVADVAWV
eukprot:COSAG04_NODE_114_length_25503_cov_39.366832_5_plen_473_part_00